MAQVVFRHGSPVMVDYTAGGTVTNGDVILVGHVPMVAHTDAVSGDKIALAASGGVYKCVPDAAIAAGQPVWWDDSADGVTETATANEHFGFTAAASYESDGFVDVVHAPQGLTGAIV